MPDLEVDTRTLADHLTWLVTRTRRMTDTKLAGRPGGHAASRADLVRVLLQQLADAEVGLARRHEPAEPTWITVPRLRDLAVGDQLAVLAHDLLDAVSEVTERDNPEAPTLWTRGGRRRLAEVMSGLAGEAGRLRELL